MKESALFRKAVSVCDKFLDVKANEGYVAHNTDQNTSPQSRSSVISFIYFIYISVMYFTECCPVLAGKINLNKGEAWFMSA